MANTHARPLYAGFLVAIDHQQNWISEDCIPNTDECGHFIAKIYMPDKSLKGASSSPLTFV